MRKNRFRYSKFTTDEFSQICRVVSPLIQEILTDLQSGEITPAEFVASYILAIQFVSLKNRSIGPQLAQSLSLEPAEHTKPSRSITQCLTVEKLLQSLQLPQHRLNSLTALQVFQNYSLTSVPLSVNRALIGWHKNTHKLKLMFHAPSADEVMSMQAAGERVVTVFANEDGAQNTFHNERDPFSFTLHDLIHADLFFGDQEQHLQQVQFFKYLNSRVYSDESIQNLKSNNKNFAERLNYLASDMNSHAAHLESYFHHLLREFNLT